MSYSVIQLFLLAKNNGLPFPLPAHIYYKDTKFLKTNSGSTQRPKERRAGAQVCVCVLVRVCVSVWPAFTYIICQETYLDYLMANAHAHTHSPLKKTRNGKGNLNRQVTSDLSNTFGKPHNRRDEGRGVLADLLRLAGRWKGELETVYPTAVQENRLRPTV